jgi:LysR family transcriptional regulator, transcriptional activator for aaeXAB operon
MEQLLTAQRLDWELFVLSRSVAYNNLSGAASHVGLSQPQLSRIVAKIEKELGIVLLDRDAKRKSAWTPASFKLAEIYSRSSRQLASEIEKLVGGSEPTLLRGATLEGLAPRATAFCHRLLGATGLTILELNVFDLSVLEEMFFKGEVDFAFTSREPGRKKFKHSQLLGYQSLDRVGKDAAMKVVSTFEFTTQMAGAAREREGKVFLSNSLVARQFWLENFGGTGRIPSAVREKRMNDSDERVLLIGRDELPTAFWAKMVRSCT